MYSVLLVDDEKIIREGVYELLSMEEELELDLVMAASAVEAKRILEERKIDIIVTDIKMPQMSGMELFDIIMEKWPYCKVIFLTGYSEFDYVYKVQKHARYVLKAEDDKKIIEAVVESIAEIENDLLMEQITESQIEHLNKTKVYERMQFLKELVDGYVSFSQVTKDNFSKMDISLDLDKEVYCIMIHHENIHFRDYEEQQNTAGKVNLLLDKYYFDLMQGTYFEYNKNFIYMLLQPKKLVTAERTIKLLEGISELFKKALMKNIAMPISIFISTQPVLFKQAIMDFNVISDKILLMAEDVLMVGCILDEEINKDDGVLKESKKQELQRIAQQLEYYITNLEKDSIQSIMRRVMKEVQSVNSMHDLFVLEIYCMISSKLLGSIKRLNLSEEMAFQIGIMNLYNVSSHSSWGEAFSYLNRVIESIFKLKDLNQEKQNEDVINKVKSYIKENLSKDTSLYVLANYVHLSQEHLLRIFKKKEGITILQYINDLKISEAKQLLTESDMQVKEIAERLGFTSAGYFGRFFKSKVMMTPHAFQERYIGR